MTKKRTIAVASAALLTFAGGAYAVAGGSAPTAITSSVTDKLSDAITAKYPGATIVGIRSEPGATGFDVEVRKSDGTNVHVELDADYKITASREGGPGPGRGFGGPGGPGGRRGHGGPRLDTAAVAKTLGVSEDKLKTALQKVRESLRPAKPADGVKPTTPGTRPAPGERRDKLAEALAKELGLDADKVKQALEDARPTPPKGEAAPPTPPNGDGAAPTTP
ncbi:MAG: hypothetical protein PGN13_00345 [Patulibacter minatonensis]